MDIGYTDLPLFLQEEMLKQQVLQGNEKDPEVFIRSIACSKHYGGFNWADSTQGEKAWYQLINYNDHSLLIDKEISIWI